MTIQTVDAVFENGVFRPISSPPRSIAEGQRVRLVMELPEPEETLRLASDVYEGLLAIEIDALERVILDRTHFFDEHQA
jgi:predicted DNA-binding antitoxin AbrB/MazE fold protein